MTTITNIRDQLIEVFNGLRAGTLEAKDAIELNNTAGKIISSAKVQIAYHALRNEVPNIPFLDAPPAEQRALPLTTEAPKPVWDDSLSRDYSMDELRGFGLSGETATLVVGV